MSGGVVSFGSYTFDNLADFDCNFADTQPKTAQLPGMDGAWNLDGDAAASAPAGTVKVKWLLTAATRAGMDALRDAVRAMAYYGIDRLSYQPTDPAAAERWTWARVQSISMGQNKGEHTDLWQPVEITFLCPEPVWWVDTYVGWTWGSGNFDEGQVWGADGYEIEASGTATTDTISQNGNTASIPQITVEPQIGDSCENPTIQRLIGATVVDEIAWTGTLNAGDILTIDGRAQAITVNGAPDWDNVSYDHPDFFRLLPGDNSIKIIFANVGDAATVTFYFQDSYR